MSTERRISDDRIVNIEKMVNELLTKQSVIMSEQSVIRTDTARIKTVLDGNGHPGLIREFEVIKTKVFEIEKLRSWVRLQMLTVVLAVVSFAYEYGMLKDMIKNHLGK